MLLYVDDLVLACADKLLLDSLKSYLMSKFKMVDFNEIKLFLGIKITRNNDTVTLDQSSYIKTIL